jgi:hypothetical protein
VTEPPRSWEYKYGDLTLEVKGVSNLRQKIWSRVQEWLCWREPAAIVNVRPVLSLERTQHKNKTATVWQQKKKISSNGDLTPRETCWLTVGRNMTLYTVVCQWRGREG